MITIICLDDNFGMMFNNRRQSRDSVITQKLIDITKDGILWAGSYSTSLFTKFTNILIDDNFLEKASAGEYCFVEDRELLPFENKIEGFIIFKWNCEYPYDKTLDIDLGNWILTHSTEFVGKSHKKITMEVYSK
jgi:hypothetical protein